MALSSDTPRSATVRAASPLDVISISRDAFSKLVTHLPGVRAPMDEVLAKHTAGARGAADPALPTGS